MLLQPHSFGLSSDLWPQRSAALSSNSTTRSSPPSSASSRQSPSRRSWCWPRHYVFGLIATSSSTSSGRWASSAGGCDSAPWPLGLQSTSLSRPSCPSTTSRRAEVRSGHRVSSRTSWPPISTSCRLYRRVQRPRRRRRRGWASPATWRQSWRGVKGWHRDGYGRGWARWLIGASLRASRRPQGRQWRWPPSQDQETLGSDIWFNKLQVGGEGNKVVHA